MLTCIWKCISVKRPHHASEILIIFLLEIKLFLFSYQFINMQHAIDRLITSRNIFFLIFIEICNQLIADLINWFVVGNLMNIDSVCTWLQQSVILVSNEIICESSTLKLQNYWNLLLFQVIGSTFCCFYLHDGEFSMLNWFGSSKYLYFQ